MWNKYFVSDSGHIKEVSLNHGDIKDTKNKDLFHYGLNNEWDNIVFLDKDRRLAKPLVKTLMSWSLKREKKFLMLSIFLLICFMFSLIAHITPPSYIAPTLPTESNINTIQSENIVKESDTRIDELNNELIQDYNNLKIDYQNLEEQIKMHSDSARSLALENSNLKNRIASDVKNAENEAIKNLENSKFELYKSIESDFYEKKKDEYKKIWYNENLKEITKQCRQAYFDIKNKHE